ncbi:hypothetical protein B566_EDAN009906 [Ephemera danica]|nr:hypothetical protein B566_EDAN009906 [Ephemera danica]
MFEPVELPAGSDSEDEDCSPGGRRVVLKPINPYANRPLPHIIGSKEFDEDDTVGLVFTPSDEEDSRAATPQQPQQMYGSSSGSELGLPSEEEDDDLFSPPRSDLPSQPLSFADELASKLGAAVGAPTTLPAVQADSKTTFPPLEQQEPPGLFGDAEDEAEDTIFGPSHGPFSASKGLFDDLITTSKVSKNSVLLFSDEDDLFAVPPMPREKSNDLFNEPASPKQKVEYMPKPTPHTMTATTKPVEKEASVKKLPAGAVSIFGGQQVFPASSHRRTASSSSDDSTNQHIVTPQTTAPEPPKMQSKIISESDDDLFAENKPPTSQTPQITKTHVSLFGDSDEDVPPQSKTHLPVDSVATTQPVARTANNVSGPSRKSSLSTDNSKIPPSKNLTSHKISLFNESDSDEDLLFASASSGGSSKLIEPARVAGRHDLFADPSNLFDGAHDLFSPNKSSQSTLFPTEDSNTVEIAKSGTAAKPSLPFEAEEVTEPQDDLFNEAKPNIPSIQKSSHLPSDLPAKPISLPFDAAEAKKPQDDLFNEAKPSIPSIQESLHLPSDLPAKPISLPFDAAEAKEPQDQDDLFNEAKPNIPSIQKSSQLLDDLPANPSLHFDAAEAKETQDYLFGKAEPNIPSVQKNSQLDIISDDDPFDTSASSKKVKEHESGTRIFSTVGKVKPELAPKVQIPVKSPQPDDIFAPSQSNDSLDAKPKTSKKPDLQTKTKTQSDNVLKGGACLIPPKTLGVTSVIFADDPTSTYLRPADVGNIPKISPVQRGRELGINPLTLLPGKKPLPSSPEVVSQEIKSPEGPTSQEEAISFDKPTSATTLLCPGKDRIRIQQKRKPSTRRGRHGQTARVQATTAPSFLAPPLLNREPPPLPPSNPISPSTDEEDMFDVLSEQADDDAALFYHVSSPSAREMFSDLFAEIHISPENHNDSPVVSKAGSKDFLKTDSNTNEDNEKSKNDDLFFIHPASNTSIAEDLFSLDKNLAKNRKSEEDMRSTTPDDLFLPSTRNVKVSASDMDLFGDLLARPNVLDVTAGYQTVLQQPTAAKDDLFSEDDVLVSPQKLAPNTSTASLPQSKRDSKNDIFGDIDDDKASLIYDIFTNWVSTKVGKPGKPTVNMDLFGDGSEDDDLFTPSVVKTSRPSSKPEANKAKTNTTVVSSEQDEFQDPLMLFQSK